MGPVPEEDLADCSKLVALLKEVARLAHDNEVAFSSPKLDPTSESLVNSFREMKSQMSDAVIHLAKQLYSHAHKYDPAADIRVNGIRSWLSSLERLSTMLLAMCSQAMYKRNSYFFRRAPFAYKLKIHTDYLCAMRKCLEVVARITKLSGDSLIFDANLASDVSVEDVVDIISEMRQIDVASFCARTACFHFCDSAQTVAQGILLAFATFSAAYGPPSPLQSAIHHVSDEQSNNSNFTPSAGAGFVSLLSNPEVLSQQIMWALANFDIAFVKQFWQLGDNPLLLKGADLLIPSVLVSQGINLHTVPLSVKTTCGEELTVEPPTIFSGLKPMKTRLLSHVLRQGQEYWMPSGGWPSAPPSDTIVFQVHGGGFICQSARAQEVYLRKLCVDSQTPFFCVDYSLLPEDPFPRATEEVLYAFCWMLSNFSKLGTTGKRIVALGDSAGGCLLLGMCIQLIELGIRCPDSMLLVYPYACSSFAPSPSRLLALADPIVPIPLLVRCCCGYANLSEDDARLVLGIGRPEDPTLVSSSPSLDTESPTCPETPIPSAFPTRRNSLSSADLSSRHRRCISAPNPLNLMVPSAAITGKTAGKGTHVRNKSDLGHIPSDLNFRRLRMSESERITLADLLSLPVFTDPLFSPLMASDDVLRQLPPLHLVGSTADPLLDDAVSLCRKMRRLGSECKFTVVEGVPHGFLNLGIVSRACHDAICKVSNVLQEIVTKSTPQPPSFMPPPPVQSMVAVEYKSDARNALYYRMFGALSIFSINGIKRRMFIAGDDE